ncbi:MAG: hypothetical protein V5B40_18485 [Candidatus Accumulibacter meliphilus]|jgi:hypothetical protein|uniref:hypothetical protein n=1 Tax=Candidatus Accumulibacter meliphilus TaxID=2211374 RepID=UPI002FC34E85
MAKQQNENGPILLFLVALLGLYLGPLYIIYIGGTVLGGFESRFAFVDSVLKFVSTDANNQELFLRIIMPLLVGLTSGSMLRNITSWPTVLLSLIFIASLGIATLLQIDLTDDAAALLLNSRGISASDILHFARNMHDALITSLTVTLGISASKEKESDHAPTQV